MNNKEEQPKAVFGKEAPDLTFTNDQLALLTKALNDWLKNVDPNLPDKRPLVLTPGGWLDLHYTLQNWLSQFQGQVPLPTEPPPFAVYHGPFH